MTNKIFKNLIPLSIIIAGILVAGALIYINQKEIAKGLAGFSAGEKNASQQILSSAQLGDKVIKYLNENILEENNTASLEEISEENGLYKLTIKIGSQGFISYATKDGKFLFTQFIDLEDESVVTPKQTEIPKTEKPDVKLFVMSFCPYGNQAEEIIKPVRELLGDKFNLTLNYIVSKGSDGKYVSLHGDQELNQDVREICVFKYQKEKFWDFVGEINKSCSYSNADSCWEGVAQGLGINVQQIKNCQNSEGNSLLAEELSLSENYKAQASPQLFINGVEYKGERTPEGYKTGICSGFSNPPSACQQTLSGEGASAQGGCQ